MEPKRLIRFDWAMKTLLRDKANFDILEGFLSALLEDDNIKILSLLESETNQTHEFDKFVQVDLLVEDSAHRKIYIEIQNTREIDFLESLLYSSSKIIVDHQTLGENFSNISKVISISILYFNLGDGSDYLYKGITEFKGLNNGERLVIREKTEIPESLSLKYSFKDKDIFPEYYLINVDRYKNQIKKNIDEWIYLFKNSEVAQGSISKNIRKTEKKLLEMNMGREEKKNYERYLRYVTREKSGIRTARIEGKKEGKKEGKAEEKIKGIIKALKRGKLTLTEIAEDFEVSLEFVIQLKKENNL
ncbi:MAG: Rpn family recombination-promoting nuclease/putative transposase [Chitinophagaceae bacterium]|nr:Rpn family recombination-promoting nuclease/putative transposase [Chitinophagaceae bacterium]